MSPGGGPQAAAAIDEVRGGLLCGWCHEPEQWAYEAALELLVDPQFQDLITNNTSSKPRVKRRFKMWDDMLEQVMEDAAQGPRLFPRSIKQELWEEGTSCSRCGQQIKVFDDAHVDHKTSYAHGGKTEKANGQLMHRYCNMSKGAKPEEGSTS